MACTVRRADTGGVKATHTTNPGASDDPPFVTASAEEIRYAEELRRRIEQRYLAPARRSDELRRKIATGAIVARR